MNKVKVIYTHHDTYAEALDFTDSGLAPLAVQMASLIPQVPTKDYPVNLKCHWHALVCMTTVFKDRENNNSWGWIHLRPRTKELLGDIMYKHNMPNNTWIFFSQTYEEQDNG